MYRVLILDGLGVGENVVGERNGEAVAGCGAAAFL